MQACKNAKERYNNVAQRRCASVQERYLNVVAWRRSASVHERYYPTPPHPNKDKKRQTKQKNSFHTQAARHGASNKKFLSHLGTYKNWSIMGHWQLNLVLYIHIIYIYMYYFRVAKLQVYTHIFMIQTTNCGQKFVHKHQLWWVAINDQGYYHQSLGYHLYHPILPFLLKTETHQSTNTRPMWAPQLQVGLLTPIKYSYFRIINHSDSSYKLTYRSH